MELTYLDFFFNEISRFLIELFFAVVIFIHIEKRRKHFAIRLSVSLVAIAGVVFLAAYIAYVILINNIGTSLNADNLDFFMNYMSVYRILIYTLSLTLFVASCYFCFNVKLNRAILSGIGGYAAQNCVFYFMMFIQQIASWNYYVVMTIAFLLVYGGTFLLVRKTKKNNIDADIDNKVVLLFSFGYIAVIILLSTFNQQSLGYGNIVSYIYAVLLDFALIIMQLGVFKMSLHRKELLIFDQLLKTERKQHEISKDTIEIINHKCHDIKHQIATLLSNVSDKDKNGYIEEIQGYISIYKSIAQTGNETLDVVLTEKNLMCDKHQIEFSHIIDGKRLAFIDTLDICVIFGNAIENAIESVISYEDIEKRFINLNVVSKAGYIAIHIENYCENNLIFVNGLPETNKDDTDFHGFGMKSIKNTVKKYAGNMLASAENNLFVLDIMIPIP